MEDLRLFLNDDQGRPLGNFLALETYCFSRDTHGAGLAFAANAGMFEPDFKPVGLLVQDGVEKSPLNLKDGTGNFCMKPNGVFLINSKHKAMVIESSFYPTLLTPAVWATQSGPLLVLAGDIHPDFNPNSKNQNVRSGVGVREDGIIVFAISRKPVTFYDFASLFLTKLECPNALYLDGVISAFYVPGMNDPEVHHFGPMFGLVQNYGSMTLPTTEEEQRLLKSLQITNAPAAQARSNR